jgi:ATP-dependent DNA helicase RecG
MVERELEALLDDLESDRVERKASLAKKEEIYQAICAFANDLPNHRAPGVVFIGVHDDGSCADLKVTDAFLRELADMRDHITPQPTATVQKRVLRGCDMAVITVHPSDSPPMRYKGRVWIRVGPRRAIASREEERRLAEKRRWRDIPFDLQPVASATIQDLDLDLFRGVYLPAAVSFDVLERNDRTIEEQLLSTRVTAPGEPPRPTVVGMHASNR